MSNPVEPRSPHGQVTTHHTGLAALIKQQMEFYETADSLVRPIEDVLAEAVLAWKAADTQWRDISTAPKDGSFVRVKDKNGGQTDASYEAGTWRFKDRWEHAGERTMLYLEPTHWQPLPQPPKGGRDE